jgi:hypothetical protein
MIVMPTDALWAGLSLSCTVAVKFEVPLAVGIPEITPVEARLSPTGRLPDVTDHLYDGIPPVACKVCE